MGKGKIDDLATRRVVGVLIDRYVRSFGDRVDMEDLTQVAAMAEASARSRFRPDGPAKLSSYVYRYVNVALFEAACRSHAPVYVCRHNVRRLLGLSVEYLGGGDYDAFPDDAFEAYDGLEGMVDRVRAYRRLREVVESAGGREALDVLLGDATLRDTADRAGVPVGAVREAKRAALAAVASDDQLRQVAREL